MIGFRRFLVSTVQPHVVQRRLVPLLVTAVVAIAPSIASATTITFEDQPDSFAFGTAFPVSYQGVTWTSGHWLHYAPYDAPYDANGVNAIYAAYLGGGLDDQSNSFTFPDQVFVGASFSAPLLLTDEYRTRLFFELYDDATLVHTSADLSSSALTFLASGYAGTVDEVRVRTVRDGGTTGSLMTAGGSAWIMDDVTFAAPTSVPEHSSLSLFGVGLAALGMLRHRWR